MKEQLLKFIEDKSPGAIPLLLVIRGSHAYGTNVETSDTDYSGVFIQKIDDILGFNYIEQINDDKNDTVIYEIQRFLQLLSSNNPTVLELLNTPEDCILYKHPIFDEVLNNRDKFITKICAKSFGGYSIQQIKKAKGQNKKQNWEKDKVTRKGVLDFVYVIEGPKSIPWKKWNEDKDLDESLCGVVNVPNAKDVYALYYDDPNINYCHYSDLPSVKAYVLNYNNKAIHKLKNKNHFDFIDCLTFIDFSNLNLIHIPPIKDAKDLVNTNIDYFNSNLNIFFDQKSKDIYSSIIS